MELTPAPPSTLGVDAAQVERFLDLAQHAGLELNSLLVHVDHGLAVEAYWWPRDREIPHMLFSATKAFVGTAVGFAVSEGLLSLDDRVAERLDAYRIPDSPYISDLRLEHLLTMTSGHDRALMGGELRRTTTSWVQALLDLPVTEPPGSRFLYSTACSHLLGTLVQQAAGQSLVAYLTPRLFEPLGVGRVSWDVDPEGYNTAGSGLSLRTVDLLRWAVCHLDHDDQVLPARWAEQVGRPRSRPASIADVTAGRVDSYGYQVWCGPDGSFYANGMFGQLAVVLPRRNAAIAVNAAVPLDRSAHLIDLFFDTLVPAIGAGGSPAADARLADRVASLAATPPQPLPQPGVDPTGTWVAEPNQDGIEAIAITATQEIVTIELVDTRGRYAVPAGFTTPVATETDVTTSSLHHAYQSDNEPVVASAAWTTPTSLELHWAFPGGPFRDTVVVEFDGDRLTWTRSVNVNSGVTARPAVTAYRL